MKKIGEFFDKVKAQTYKCNPMCGFDAFYLCVQNTYLTTLLLQS